MKIKIIDDLYDIAWRIKAINNAYEIYYDTVKHRFEITADGRLQLVVPYLHLDGRTVDYVNRTRIENIDKILADTDRKNDALSAYKEKKVKETCAYKAKQLSDYLSRGGNDIPSYDNI